MKVHIRKHDQSTRPNLENSKTITLKEGPKVRKVAKHNVVLDEHTGKFHHDAFTIKTYALRKNTCDLDQRRSISLDGAEAQALADFIIAARSGALPSETGSFVLARAEAANASATRKLQAFSDPERANALSLLLKQASENPSVFAEVLERAASDGAFMERAAAAINLAIYRQAVSELERLIATSDREGDFQRLLSRHPWMFGSGYSSQLDRRRWTRDEIQDFVLRRTTDGYVELIEIKTPMNGTRLFNRDSSHDTYYPSADLSKVVGQVMNYLEKLDRERNSIKANDGEDTTKTRAKIVIGRDGDNAQRQALWR
ncbi:Shedu anti-phage system protein SduA domain-containing protein [Microvirga massiliensis]|uniref:Shedu anti-phage system protein SduA domain-containing protein n=1 Tax=Microvirga massiliensis TaxID=1033741 RepID=UPI000AB9DF5A|nr:Shedu anti-phage system protein SduA domain-containing protein [Microvirga massiliensis]